MASDPQLPAPKAAGHEKVPGSSVAGQLLALKVMTVELGKLILADPSNPIDFEALSTRTQARGAEIVASIGHPELRDATEKAIADLLASMKTPA